MKFYLNDIGGLGNRMFIYSLFLSLKKAYQSKVFIVSKKSKSDVSSDELFRLTSDNSFFEHRIDFNSLHMEFKNFIEHVIFYIRKRTVSKDCSNSFELEKHSQSFINKIGYIKVTDGYIPFKVNNNIHEYFCTGYFQSKKYWDNVEDLVNKSFYHPELIDDRNNVFLKTIQNSNSVCVHVRLGDYVNNEVARKKHYVCTPEYFKKAIDQAQKDLKKPLFIVFTNDIAQAKSIFSDYPNMVYSKDDNEALVDLQLMIQCKNFIISNSTFSWWAQYLSRNHNKVVYAPSKWYNDNTVTDLYDDNWIIINVEEE